MYKKHKIVLIKSNEDANVGSDNWYLPNSQQLVIDNKISHLYILSDDDVVEGDWYIHKQNNNYKVRQCVGINLPMDSKKIIASTDKSLIIEEQLSFIRSFEGEIPKQYSLPLIPEYFIKYYIEQYNLGNVIQEVEVLYNEHFEEDTTKDYIIGKGQPAIRIEYIDVDDYNNIVIKSPGCNNTFNEDKTYLRSEVVELLHKFRNSPNRAYDFSMEDWIEQNLK